MNKNYEVATKTQTAFYSDSETSIIPIDANQVILLPPAGAVFEQMVQLKETTSTFRFGVYDLYAPEAQKSFSEIYDYLTDDQNLFSKNESLEDSMEYEVDKYLISDFLDRYDESFPFEELMSALTQILVEFPYIRTFNGESRRTTPDDIILVLENLTQNVHIEEALKNLLEFSSEEMSKIIHEDSDNKYNLYLKIIDSEIDNEPS